MSKEISIKDSIALVSGANRGIGKAITEELLNKGIKKVYAGARISGNRFITFRKILKLYTLPAK